MKRLLILIFLAVVATAQAATTEPYTKALITMTNLANFVTGSSIDVNGDVRRATNGAPADVSKWVHITNSIVNQVTNWMRHFNEYSPSGTEGVWTNGATATNFYLVGMPSETLTVTLSTGSGNWGFVTYETNQWTNTFPVYMPFTTELPTTRTSIVSDFVASMNAFASNSLGTNTKVMEKFTDLLSAQTVSNKNLRAGTMEGTILTNVDARRINMKSFGTGTTPFGQLMFYNDDPIPFTAIRSDTNGYPSIYVVEDPTYWLDDALSITSLSNNPAAILNVRSAVNVFPLLTAEPSINLNRGSNFFQIPNYWTNADNTFTRSLKLPGGFTASYGTWTGGTGEVNRLIVTNLVTGSNATALITNLSGEALSLAATTLIARANALLTNINGEANSLVVTTLTARAGSTSNLTHHSMTGSNVVFANGSTNILGGDLSFPMYGITLANGDNSDVKFGTNTFVAFTGPSAEYRISSFVGPRDGRAVFMYFGAGYNATILNDSGIGSPADANKILTLSGADQTSSGNAFAVTFYHPTLQRWIFSWLNRGSGAGSAGVNFDTNAFNVNGGTVTLATNFVATGMVHRAQARLNADIEGLMWNDATQRAMRVYLAGTTQALSSVLISLTNSVSVANTTTETSFFPLGSCVGNTNLSTTFWAPGKRVRIDVSGIWQASGAVAKTFRVRIGSATPVSFAFTPGGAVGPGIRFRFQATLTCRATGSSGTVVQSAVAEMWTSASAISYAGTASSSTTAINTTVAHGLDVTVQHGSAGATDTITAVEGSIEVLN